jgi:hypothetical protein
VTYLHFNFLYLFPVLVEDVFSYKLRSFEFFTTHRTQPFILSQLLCISYMTLQQIYIRRINMQCFVCIKIPKCSHLSDMTVNHCSSYQRVLKSSSPIHDDFGIFKLFCKAENIIQLNS